MQAQRHKKYLEHLNNEFTFQEALEVFNRSRGLSKIPVGTVKNHITKMLKLKMITNKNPYKKKKTITYQKNPYNK